MRTRTLVLAGAVVALALGWVLPKLARAPSDDEIAMTLLAASDPRRAALLFDDPAWRGVAEFRAGRFARAAEQFAQVDSLAGQYNLGNALAWQGAYVQAISVYERVLGLQPDHTDAQHNLDIVRKIVGVRTSSDPQAEQGAGNAGEQGEDVERPDPGSASAPENQQDEEADVPLQADGQDADSSESRESEQAGTPARSTSEADAERAESLPQAGPSEVRERESRQAAGILLRGIEDDPAAVLRARFHARHQQIARDAR